MAYCRWILRPSAADLGNYAYADGTTSYFARSLAEQTGKQRAALGPCAWRMANGKDAWLNACQRHAGWKLRRGQKSWANAVLQLRGAKCKH